MSGLSELSGPVLRNTIQPFENFGNTVESDPGFLKFSKRLIKSILW